MLKNDGTIGLIDPSLPRRKQRLRRPVHVVELRRNYDEPAEDVWDACTDPERIAAGSCRSPPTCAWAGGFSWKATPAARSSSASRRAGSSSPGSSATAAGAAAIIIVVFAGFATGQLVAF
jgi:hypothetical protein